MESPVSAPRLPRAHRSLPEVPPLHIGLVYDLRTEYLEAGYSEEETAEFDQEGTIDSLEEALRELGHRTERIGHAFRLCQRLSEGQRWDLVFNIAEGLYGYGREALVPAILDHHRIPYTFSDPLVSATTLHKATAKRLVAAIGVPTPEFAVIETVEDLDRVELQMPVFVKPIAEGTGKGVSADSIVRDRAWMRDRCFELLERYRQPVLVETLLPGRELTVGILGTGTSARALGTLEVTLRPGAEEGVYSYFNKERCEDLVEYVRVSAQEDPTVQEAERVALAAWRALGCRDGGRIDLRCDRHGQPSFLEANPLAGLHPLHSDLPILATEEGMTYLRLIEEIVHSAWSRVGAKHVADDRLVATEESDARRALARLG